MTTRNKILQIAYIAIKYNLKVEAWTYIIITFHEDYIHTRIVANLLSSHSSDLSE